MNKLFTALGIAVLALLFYRVTKGTVTRVVHMMHQRDIRKTQRPSPVRDKWFAIWLPIIIFIGIFLLLLTVK
ncbi:hypothetical protein ACMC5U_02935 [Deferribacteres bacterium DY0609]